MRGATFYFRVRIPTQLVSAYGRTHVSLSLATTDKAVARARAREHRVALERELQALQDQVARPAGGVSSTVLHLTDADIDGLCSRYRAAMLANDELQRIKGLSPSLQIVVKAVAQGR